MCPAPGAARGGGWYPGLVPDASACSVIVWLGPGMGAGSSPVTPATQMCPCLLQQALPSSDPARCQEGQLPAQSAKPLAWAWEWAVPGRAGRRWSRHSLLLVGLGVVFFSPLRKKKRETTTNNQPREAESRLGACWCQFGAGQGGCSSWAGCSCQGSPASTQKPTRKLQH